MKPALLLGGGGDINEFKNRKRGEAVHELFQGINTASSLDPWGPKSAPEIQGQRDVENTERLDENIEGLSPKQKKALGLGECANQKPEGNIGRLLRFGPKKPGDDKGGPEGGGGRNERL